jgi:predicted dehydrogenase
MHEVLIVGCGNIAGGFDRDLHHTDTPLTHAGAYRRHGGFALTACVEPDAERRRAFMERWQVAQGFASMAEAAVAGLRPTVVSICSPTSAHFDDARAALRLSPPILFCEKPVTPELAQTRILVDECAARGVSLVVNYTRRWDPSVLRLAAELRAGRWGALRSVSGTYNKGVNNNGSHMIDLLGLLLGDVQVLATGPARADFFAQDPSIPALLLAAGEVPVMLNIGNAVDYSLFELELVTERALIRMEAGGLQWRIRLAEESRAFRGYRSLETESCHAGTLGEAMLAAVGDIDCILRQGGEAASTGANALRAQAICETLRDRALGVPLTQRGEQSVEQQ